MECLYNINIILMRIVFYLIVVNLALRCILTVYNVAVRIALLFKIQSKQFASIVVLNRRILSFFWIIVLIILLMLWSKQAELLFNKITRYDVEVNEDTIVGEWVDGNTIIQFAENNLIKFNQDVAKLLKLKKDIPYQWRLDETDLYIETKNNEILAKWKLVEFNKKLRICTDYSWEHHAIKSLGFQKQE